MKLIYAEKETENGILIIITDADLLGKKIEEGRFQLDLTKEFYAGEEKQEEEIKEKMKKARYIHLTGKKAVELGLNLGLVKEKRIFWVNKIPHAEGVIEN